MIPAALALHNAVEAARRALKEGSSRPNHELHRLRVALSDLEALRRAWGPPR